MMVLRAIEITTSGCVFRGSDGNCIRFPLSAALTISLKLHGGKTRQARPISAPPKTTKLFVGRRSPRYMRFVSIHKIIFRTKNPQTPKTA